MNYIYVLEHTCSYNCQQISGAQFDHTGLGNLYPHHI